MPWECGIQGCGKHFDDPETAIVHQTNEHERRECRICGVIVPDGYLAIRHVFNEHSRADYVRAYGASAEEVREREDVKDTIEERADLEEVVDRLGGSPSPN